MEENNDEEIRNVLNELINNEDETTEKILNKKKLKEEINFMKPVINNIVVIFITIMCIIFSIIIYEYISDFFDVKPENSGTERIKIVATDKKVGIKGEYKEHYIIETIEGVIGIFIVIKNSIKGIFSNIKYLKNNKKSEKNKLAILSTILLSIEIIIAVLMLIFLILIDIKGWEFLYYHCVI